MRERSLGVLLWTCLLVFSSNLRSATYLDISQLPDARNISSLNEKSFEISPVSSEKIRASFITKSFKWLRYEEVLLIPTARLEVVIETKDTNGYELVYKNNAYSFQRNQSNSSVEFDFSLFERESIEIYNNGELIENIKISRKHQAKPLILIDDTCSRNAIDIQGLSTEAISVGCKIIKTGEFGNEEPVLEVKWISPELKRYSGISIQTAVFNHNSTHRIKVQNKNSKAQKTFSISAKIPKRIHRLFTAAGLGPYVLETALEQSDDIRTIYEPVAPALFLYANYQISKDQSVRGFNAAVFKESVFDNAGVYLGSDFGFSFDNRLYFTTLIGMQYLYFKFDKEAKEISEPIFPQGIEFMYRHAFDIPNYIVSGGFFINTSTEIEYQNAWIRWGEKYFWELNYIGWAKDNFSAKMWGLSIGFPLKGFL